MKKMNIFVASIFLIVSVLFFISSRSLISISKNEVVSSGTIPMIISTLLFVLSLVWIAMEIHSSAHQPKDRNLFTYLSNNKKVLAAICLVLAFIIVMDFTNFYIATFLFLSGFMFILTPAKDLKHILLILAIAIGFNIAIYLVLAKLLRVYLP